MTAWPERITVTDPTHPLYGREFQLAPMTGPIAGRVYAHAAYIGGAVLKIPVAATSLHSAQPGTPRSKLSLDAIRDLLRLSAQIEGTEPLAVTSPRPTAGRPVATSPPHPAGEEP
jgi:hypothetical protein